MFQSSGSRWRAALCAAALAGGETAYAALPPCMALELPEQAAGATLWRVSGTQSRVHFRHGPDRAGCPDLGAGRACERKAYVVAGDRLIRMAEAPGLSCVAYVGQQGRSTVGWVATQALEPATDAPVSGADWAGRWRREDDAELRIEALDDGWLAVSGAASWGGDDPERVARGAVHSGEIERTEVLLTAPVVQLTGLYDCVLRLQRIDAVLLAADNGQCGGMNVRFSGVYLRR